MKRPTSTPEGRAAIALLASWGLSVPLASRWRSAVTLSEITLVRQARAAGAPWWQIGEATGYTMTGARRRWLAHTY